MAEPARRQAPRFTESERVRLAPPASRWVLRGAAPALAAAGAAFGPVPSTLAGRAVVLGARAALWLGPDEQLLLAPASEADALAAALAGALAPLPHSLVDVSHRQVGLTVSGRHATLLLNAGCPLDLAVSEFPSGTCTRTVFAKAEVVLWRTDVERFHLEVWRSFAGYVSELLAEIGRELRA